MKYIGFLDLPIVNIGSYPLTAPPVANPLKNKLTVKFTLVHRPSFK